MPLLWWGPQVGELGRNANRWYWFALPVAPPKRKTPFVITGTPSSSGQINLYVLFAQYIRITYCQPRLLMKAQNYPNPLRCLILLLLNQFFLAFIPPPTSQVKDGLVLSKAFHCPLRFLRNPLQPKPWTESESACKPSSLISPYSLLLDLRSRWMMGTIASSCK